MHPPDFSIHHRLADWPGCTLELRHGDRTFKEMIPRLQCKQCGGHPAPVYLIAGFHRTNCKGPQPCWAVELVAAD